MKIIRPLVVVSKCLAHDNCRYDGTMIGDPFVKSLLPYVDFIPVCPEVEIGLSTPRKSLRIIEDNGEKLVVSSTSEDLTDKMHSFSMDFIKSLKGKGIDGFILKGRSPSCGIKEVKVYKGTDNASKLPYKTKGIFARNIYEYFPDFEIEEEGRLSNYNIREHFLIKLWTRASFKGVMKSGTIKSLVDFHSNNKYLFMALSPGNLKTLGKIVANNDKLDINDIINNYELNLNKLLKVPPQTGRNINMLLHIFGYFSKYLNDKEKAYFLETIEKYRSKKIPFSVPLSILNSWNARFQNEYLVRQTIFSPFPEDIINVTDSGKGL